jgi:hypothetical protein
MSVANMNIATDEVDARLEELWATPWSGRTQPARERLLAEGERVVAPKLRGRLASAADATVQRDSSLRALQQGLESARDQDVKERPTVEPGFFRFPEGAAFARLDALFRPHWQRPITRPQDLAFRDAFDEALARLQLVELAVVTGYVPLDAVRQRTRAELMTLLWPPAAREYLRTYDFLGVRFLAARVEIDLRLPAVSPPVSNPRAAVRYATFLSQLETWHKDPNVDEWLGFLDDYVEYDDEPSDVERFLRTGKIRAKDDRRADRFQRLAAGADRVLQLLADLFNVLPENERPLFGIYHAYWMQKLFGYSFDDDKRRYVKSAADDWSTLLMGRAFVTDTMSTPIEQQLVTTRVEQLKDASAFWKVTREFLEMHL